MTLRGENAFTADTAPGVPDGPCQDDSHTKLEMHLTWTTTRLNHIALRCRSLKDELVNPSQSLPP